MKQNNRLWWGLSAVMLICLLAFSSAFAESGSYEYGMARSMLDLINNFRTGSEAWYWESDNVTQKKVNGLRPLTYDTELEKAAMLRASELVNFFSHTRPDGSKWSTAFPQGNFYRGENIAYGFTTAEGAFEGFKEDQEPYEGQGHRRNMLKSEFTRVGIGAYRVGNVIYWAQAFASGRSGGSDSSAPASDSSKGTWKEINGTFYYVQSDGGRATGWLQDGNDWYYLDPGNGAMKTGWVDIGGEWYYFRSSSGAMVTGMVNINGQNEYFDHNGVWQYSETPGTETIEEYNTPLGPDNLLLQTIRCVVQFVLNIIQ